MTLISEERFEKLEDKINKLLERSKKLDDLVHNQKVLNDKFVSFQNVFDDFRKKYEAVMKDAEGLKKDVKFLQAENKALKNEVKDLRVSMEESVHSGMANELEIVGIQARSGENLKAIVVDIGKKISVKISEADVTAVARKEFGKKKISYLHVKLSSASLRDSVIYNGRKLRLKGEDIGFVGSKNSIYFNECLSFHSRKVFFEAKKLKTDLNYKYLWIKRGKIYLRKADKEPAILIACLNDIATLRS